MGLLWGDPKRPGFPIVSLRASQKTWSGGQGDGTHGMWACWAARVGMVASGKGSSWAVQGGLKGRASPHLQAYRRLAPSPQAEQVGGGQKGSPLLCFLGGWLEGIAGLAEHSS